MANLRKFIPLFDRVLVQRIIPETTTKGGIVIPDKSVGKANEGTVVAVGEGVRNEDGKTVPCCVKEGDQVLLPEFGGTKIEMEGQEFHLFREGDLLGKFN